jgi:glycosyltransferase involved in cell wall biosynthesis
VDQGIEVTVYCRERKDGLSAWNEGGVNCRFTPGVESKALSTVSFGLSNHIDASRRNFDAALVLNIANGFYLPRLARKGIGTALNTDGIEWERGKWGRAARRFFLEGAKASARNADVLIADSRGIADIWRDRFGVESEFIPYGAPVLEPSGDDRVLELGMAPGTYALVVARVIPENNVELTLDALESGPPVPAVVVGSANYDSPIEKRLAELNERGVIRWLGHVRDQELLNQLWSNAGVYVHGHSVGGTNPALLQALGAGAPSIALDTVFNREVIKADEQLYQPDAAILGGLIRDTLADPERQRRWSARGRDIVREHYSWPDIADRYLDALRLAAERRQRTSSARTRGRT